MFSFSVTLDAVIETFCVIAVAARLTFTLPTCDDICIGTVTVVAAIEIGTLTLAAAIEIGTFTDVDVILIGMVTLAAAIAIGTLMDDDVILIGSVTLDADMLIGTIMEPLIASSDTDRCQSGVSGIAPLPHAQKHQPTPYARERIGNLELWTVRRGRVPRRRLSECAHG